MRNDNFDLAAMFENAKNAARNANDPEQVSKNNIQEIQIDSIKPSPYNPVPLYTGEKAEELMESIRATGVRQPILIRPKGEGLYEMVDGHNRLECARKIGLQTIPAIIKNYSDEEAEFNNNDAIINQRGLSDLKPSVRAKVIYQYDEALKRNQFSVELKNVNESNSAGNDKKRMKQRYLRLYRCSDELKNLVDDNVVPLTIAIELADINHDMQHLILSKSKDTGKKIDAKIAKLLKEKNKKKELTEEVINEIFTGKKRQRKSTTKTVKVPLDMIHMYFEGKKQSEIETIVAKAISFYFSQQTNQDD